MRLASNTVMRPQEKKPVAWWSGGRRSTWGIRSRTWLPPIQRSATTAPVVGSMITAYTSAAISTRSSEDRPHGLLWRMCSQRVVVDPEVVGPNQGLELGARDVTPRDKIGTIDRGWARYRGAENSERLNRFGDHGRCARAAVDRHHGGEGCDVEVAGFRHLLTASAPARARPARRR